MALLLRSVALIVLLLNFYFASAIDVAPGQYIVQVRGACDAACRSKVAEAGTAQVGTPCTVPGTGSRIGTITFVTLKCEVSPSGPSIASLDSLPPQLQNVQIASDDVFIIKTSPNFVRSQIGFTKKLSKDTDSVELNKNTRLINLDGIRTKKQSEMLESLPDNIKENFRHSFPGLLPSVTPSTTPSTSPTPSTTPSTTPTPSSSPTPSVTPTKSMTPVPTSSPTPSKSPSPTPFRNRHPSPSPTSIEVESKVSSQEFSIPTDGSESTFDMEPVSEDDDDEDQYEPIAVGDTAVVDNFVVDGDFSGEIAPTGRQLFRERVFNKPVVRQTISSARIILLCNGRAIVLRQTVSCSGSLLPMIAPQKIEVEMISIERNGRRSAGISIAYKTEGPFGNACRTVFRFDVTTRRRLRRGLLPSLTPISAPSRSPIQTPSSSPISESPSVSPLVSGESVSPSPSASVSSTTSGSASASPTTSRSASVSPSTSASATVSPSTSASATVSPSTSASATVSPSTSASASVSPSTSASATVSPSTSASVTVSPSTSASVTVSPSSSTSTTVSPSASASTSITPSVSPSASVSPSQSPSASASASTSPSASISASLSATPSISASPSSSSIQSPTPSLTPAHNAIWNIDQTDGVRDGKHTCIESNHGEGIDVWVLDSGCNPYRGGACLGQNAGNAVGCADDGGHGSHVAGTVGSEAFGVAFRTTISCYKCLHGPQGIGYVSDIIDGIAAAVAAGGQVINLSLGGDHNPNNQPLVDAIDEAVQNHDVYFAIAAGNDRDDACNYDPAVANDPANGIFTVHGHNINDVYYSESNYGTCASLSAPGRNVLSYVLNGATAYYSGTSMATPHVAGVIARLLSDGKPVTLDALIELGGNVIDRNGDNVPMLAAAC